MKRALLMCLVLLGTACTSAAHKSATPAPASTTTTARPAPLACTAKPISPGTYQRALTFRGVTHPYVLVIPKHYSGRTRYPLVFGLHALTVSYQFVPSQTGFTDDVIGVAPSGEMNGTSPFWIAAPVPGNADVAFINALLDRLEAQLCVDPRRVFATGMSNGAQMSSVLACQLADRITAVAPVAGVEYYPSCSGRPVPVIAFHGKLDPIVLYNGGGLNSETIDTQNLWKGKPPSGLPVFHGVDSAMRAWAAHNRCDPTPVDKKIASDVVQRTWQHCAAATELYIVTDGGHSWPGKPVPAFEAQFGKTTTAIDASQLIFSFFHDQPPLSG